MSDYLSESQSAVLAEAMKRLHWVRSGREQQERTEGWLIEHAEKARAAGIPEGLLQAVMGDDLPAPVRSNKETDDA